MEAFAKNISKSDIIIKVLAVVDNNPSIPHIQRNHKCPNYF